MHLSGLVARRASRAGLLVLWGFATVIERESVRLAPFPCSLVPFSPNPLYRIPSRRILILIRWHRPLRGWASELHFTYPGVLDPGTPLCKVIAARKSCWPLEEIRNHPSAREKTDGARPR